MAWTVEEVEYFKPGLTAAQKKRWVKIANAQLDMCTAEGGDILDCEVHAIRAANNKFSDDSYNLAEATCSIEKVNFGKGGQLQEVTYQEVEVTDEYQMVLPIGLFNTKWYGEVIITKTFCDMMVKNWKNEALYNRKPFVDEMHRREKAFGWIKDLQVRADGLYAKIDWTSLGTEAVNNKIYMYFSADIDWAIDIRTKEEYYPVLVAVSLCNTPVMNTMDTVRLSEEGAEALARYAGMLKRHEARLAKKSKSAIMGNEHTTQSDGASPAHSDGADVSYQEHKMPTIEDLLKLFGELKPEDQAKFVAQLTEILNSQESGEGSGQAASGAGDDPAAQAASGAQAGGGTQAGGGQAAGAQLSTTGNQNAGTDIITKTSQELGERIKKLMVQIQAASGAGEAQAVGAPTGQAGQAILTLAQQNGEKIPSAVLAMIQGQEAVVNQLSEKLERINAESLAKRKEALFKEAIETGRITPAKKEFFENLFDENPDGIEKIIKNLPASKIFSTIGTGDDGKKIVLNESKGEKTLREGFGLTAEDMEKYENR